MPLRLSWRISQTKNATSGSTKTAQNISEGMFIIIVHSPWLIDHGIYLFRSKAMDYRL